MPPLLFHQTFAVPPGAPSTGSRTLDIAYSEVNTFITFRICPDCVKSTSTLRTHWHHTKLCCRVCAYTRAERAGHASRAFRTLSVHMDFRDLEFNYLSEIKSWHLVLQYVRRVVSSQGTRLHTLEKRLGFLRVKNLGGAQLQKRLVGDDILDHKSSLYLSMYYLPCICPEGSL